MWKQLLLMAVILSGLIAAERVLSQRQAEQRRESVRIAEIASEEEFDRPIAALRLEVGEQLFLYEVLSDGMWRSFHAYGAPAVASAIESVLMMLLEGEGVIQSREPAAPEEYGFDTPEMIRVAFCGEDVFDDPTGDVIYSIDLGRSIGATGGSYVRRTGESAVWAIDQDLRTVIGYEAESGIPPMIDPHVVPQAWPGVQTGIRSIVIERPQGRPSGAPGGPLRLTRHDLDLSEEERQAGLPPWQWMVSEGDRTEAGDLFNVIGYASFLMQVPHVGILAPRPPEQLGLDSPRALLTLESAEGHRAQLIVGGRAPRGGGVVFSTISGVAFEVHPDHVDLLLPEADMLLHSEHGENPWERFLWRRERPQPPPLRSSRR